MSMNETMKGRKALLILAIRKGKTLDEIEEEIRMVIESIWDNPDPDVQRKQKELFPEGKPTPAVFVARLAHSI